MSDPATPQSLRTKLRILLRDSDQALWSDDGLENVIEAVCRQHGLTLKGAQRTSVLWGAIHKAIDEMLKGEVPVQLSAEKVATYRDLMVNADGQFRRCLDAQARILDARAGVQ